MSWILVITLMNISQIDLNLLVYLDTLLEEKSVTKAAAKLSITQPALSNGLKRLRTLLGDPLLIRTSHGMAPTARAEALQPQIRQALRLLESSLQISEYEAASSQSIFRIMISDYGESTLIPHLVSRLQQLAPDTQLDILNPSDITFHDVEQGKIDMAINRFDQMPSSFHQKTVWYDNYSCLMHKDNPAAEPFDLPQYLAGHHIWVSKTGMGKGIRMTSDDARRLGRVDEVLSQLGHKRQIRVFTRHYQVAALLAQQPHLIATLPARLANLYRQHPSICVRKPPFMIPPFELKMAWSPLLHHNSRHRWLREQVTHAAETVLAQQIQET